MCKFFGRKSAFFCSFFAQNGRKVRFSALFFTFAEKRPTSINLSSVLSASCNKRAASETASSVRDALRFSPCTGCTALVQSIASRRLGQSLLCNRWTPSNRRQAVHRYIRCLPASAQLDFFIFHQTTTDLQLPDHSSSTTLQYVCLDSQYPNSPWKTSLLSFRVDDNQDHRTNLHNH